LGEAYAVAGTDDERRLARDALRTPRPNDVSGEVMSFVYEGTIGRIVGLLDAALGDLDSAERELRQAHATALARKHSPWVAQTGYELAKVLHRAGRGAEAGALMSEAAKLARALGMPGLERSAIASVSDESLASPVVSGVASLNVTFEKNGSEYRVARGPASVVLKDSRGAQLLARLCASPLEEIHVLALASDEPGASIPETDAGEMLDDAAKRAYRARLTELEDGIVEAERLGDARRANKLQKEKDALLDELKRAAGLGGRTRKTGSATERARVNVQRRVKDAIAKIAEGDAELGRFFESSVRTGTFCCFRPK
jgi:hypothetical protein